MRELIVGIVVDVLRKIVVNGFELFLVFRIAAAARDFIILDPGEFVVLDPKIGFKDFCSGGKPEQGRVAFREPSAVFSGIRLSQKL